MKTENASFDNVIFTVLITAGLSLFVSGIGLEHAFAIFTLPGTFLHEAAHYMAGMISGASPSGFSITPSLAEDTLGTVDIIPTASSAAVTALAPILLIPFALALYLIARRRSFLPAFALCYVSFTTLVSSLPSQADLQVAKMYALQFNIVAPLMVMITIAASLFVWKKLS